jgi:ankyrin repeat protein
MHLDKIIRNSETVEQAKGYRAKMTNDRDFYYNNSLMLACIYGESESKQQDKYNCIRLLKDSGCKLNIRNNESGFTCMHWVARWGEIENIIYLCEAGTAIYLPDNLGYIPLDYAGLFRHKKAMIYLIKKGIEQAKW